MTYQAKPLPHRQVSPPALMNIRFLSAVTGLTIAELSRIRIAAGIADTRGKKSRKAPLYPVAAFPVRIQMLVQRDYEAAARSRARCIVIPTIISTDEDTHS